MRLGLISDTHGLLRPEARAALAGVDVILHAGDVGSAAVLEALRALAPVHAVRGNVDRWPGAEALPELLELVLMGRPVRVQHVYDGREAPPNGLLVVGHSHKPQAVASAGGWRVNPGSAGPRRFSLPVGLAWAEIDEGGLSVGLINLR